MFRLSGFPPALDPLGAAEPLPAEEACKNRHVQSGHLSIISVVDRSLLACYYPVVTITARKACGLPSEALAQEGNPKYCMTEKTPQYELAYHLDPNLDDVKVHQIREETEQFIGTLGGVIAFSKEPEKIRLSYPVRHQRSSYFGYLHFTLPEREKLAQLDEYLRLNTNVFRYLALKIEPESEKQKAARVGMAQREQKRPVRKTEPAAPSAKPEEIEKQLEEVIGKL